MSTQTKTQQTSAKTLPSAIRQFCRHHWILNVRIRDIPGEAFAGLSGAAVVLPQGIAFASIAGLPPEYGLYSAMVPTIIAAVFGSSTIMITGPTTAISAVVFSVLSKTHAVGSPEFIQMAVVLSLMVGTIQLLLAAVRAGDLAKFVSHSVMVGFTIAAALLIVVSQLGTVLGLQIASGGTAVERIVQVIDKIAYFEVETVIVATTTFAIASFLATISAKIPSFLIALVGGTLISVAMMSLGFEFDTIGAIDSILPTFSNPGVSWGEYISILEGALTIALIGLLEALAIGKAFSARTKTKFSPNKETYAQGLSNVVGGLFQAYPSSGSFTRTGVNFASGARTPLAAVFSGALLLPLLYFCAPLFAYVPAAAIAGLILYVAIRLVDFGELRWIARSGKTDILTVAITFIGGAILHLETALLVGVAFSIGSFLLRTSKTKIRVEAPDQLQVGREFRDVDDYGQSECPQVLFTRVDGPMYFGTAENLNQEFISLAKERPSQTTLVINLKGTGDIDAEGVSCIVSEINRRRQSGGDTAIVARSISMVERLEKLGLTSSLCEAQLFENKNHAIREIVPKLDRSVCQTCEANIFRECKKNKSVSKNNALDN